LYYVEGGIRRERFESNEMERERARRERKEEKEARIREQKRSCELKCSEFRKEGRSGGRG
jgi:hypothetical protein